MTEKVKYKFRSNFGENVSKYNITLTKNINYRTDVALKDKSEYLHPSQRKKKALVIEDSGNGITVDIEGHLINLDYDEESYLLAALWARAVEYGSELSMRKVNVSNTKEE